MITDSFSINKASLTDLPRLKEICEVTFYDTYADYNTPADMEQYLISNFSLERLTSDLKNPECEFHLAETGADAVGYIKINVGKAQTETQLENALEIERIYVKPDFKGNRIGKRLLETAHKVAYDRNLQRLWLGVWEKNPKAISFYKKHGFQEFDKHVFKLGNDLQTDLMMKLELGT